MAFQIFDQRLTMGCTFFLVAQRIDFQLYEIADAQTLPQVGGHQDDFGIDVRPGEAKCFDADLVELAVATFLRTLVPEHRPRIPELLGGVVKQVVLDHRAQGTGRTFRTQRQAVAVQAVGKGVHFLLDDVGHFTDRADEQRC